MKLHSTPDDPARAVLEGVERIIESAWTQAPPPASMVGGRGGPPPRVAVEVIHGTTVATNALLTRSGAQVVLLTTAGMEDVLEIGRQDRPALYDLHPTLPPPLVPRELRLGVKERVGVSETLRNAAEVLTPLSAAETARIVRRVRRLKPEAVAVCLLHSYMYPLHEQQLAAALASALPADAPVFLSSALDPQPREYERTSTTVIHAYLARSVSSYLQRLEAGLRELAAGLGCICELSILSSSGGTLSVAQACARPAELVLSGPAGGVRGAAEIKSRWGSSMPVGPGQSPRPQGLKMGADTAAPLQRQDQDGPGQARPLQELSFIGLDMGGTSTDVCPGWEGRVELDSGRLIEGLPLRSPRLAVHTIGAGGGSLARAGLGGALLVGPQSAGANPGPAAYGRGEGVTVTDAALVAGRLPAGLLLGAGSGALRLDLTRARRFVSVLANSLKLSVEQCADGILALAEQHMAQAVRQVSQARGYDPRECVLLPFGGAGALCACGIAELLGMRRILIPAQAGCLSALGAVLSSPQQQRVVNVMREVDVWPASDLRALLGPHQDELTASFKGVSVRAVKFDCRALCRYRGQGHELSVPCSPSPSSARNVRLADDFHRLHEQRYGMSHRGTPVEVVSLVLSATAMRPLDPALLNFTADWRRADSGKKLPAGRPLRGPAVLLEPSCTVYVAQGWTASLDGAGNLSLSR